MDKGRAKVIVMPLICEIGECLETKGVRLLDCEHLSCPEHADPDTGFCLECGEVWRQSLAENVEVLAKKAAVVWDESLVQE